jgi:hypothetical protein
MKYGEHKAVLWGKLVTTAQPISAGSCRGCINADGGLGACFSGGAHGPQDQAGFLPCNENDHIYVDAIPGLFKGEQADPYAHYFKDVRHLDTLDVYRVIDLFEVTDPCIQHAIKKLLCAGSRGQKDMAKDITEASDSLARWHEMREEDARKEPK